MKNFIAIITVFLSFASMLAVEGSQLQTVDQAVSVQAWSMLENLPDDIPTITGGGLIVEPELNGFGRKVWLLASEPGYYFIKGVAYDTGSVRLGEFGIDNNIYSRTLMIFDSQQVEQMVVFPTLAQIEVMRINGGVIERSFVNISSWYTPEKKLKANESVWQGQYHLTTSFLDPGSIAIVGRTNIGVIERSPFGSNIILPENIWLPLGYGTLTICSPYGECQTVVFERNLSLGGKG